MFTHEELNDGFVVSITIEAQSGEAVSNDWGRDWGRVLSFASKKFLPACEVWLYR